MEWSSITTYAAESQVDNYAVRAAVAIKDSRVSFTSLFLAFPQCSASSISMISIV